jgi:hypothetical protein
LKPEFFGNADIEKDLQELPDQVASALEDWNIKKLEREKVEALLHMAFKASDLRMTVADVKAATHADGKRYQATLEEIKAETQYNRLYEKLMSAKKLASLRTAY